MDNARRVLTEEIRSLTAAVVLTTADPDTVQRALALVRQASAELGSSARTSRYDGVPGLSPGSADNEAIWETHAAFGQFNPMAPPLDAEEHAGHVTATVTFAPAWEGGPGLVYGGLVASAFDGMLGRAVISAGWLGVTRTLTVRYLRPTPLGVPLRMDSTAGEVTGRNVAVSARLWSGETVTAEADAVFTCVDPDRYRK